MVRVGGTSGRVSVVVDATVTDGVAEAAACLGAIEAQSMAPDETVVLVSADALRVDGQARAVVVPPG
jgi:hypothetical protein